LAEGFVTARLTGRTGIVGIIGWPVEHSLSPVIHNTAFAAMEMDRVYVPFPVPPGQLAAALDGLRALGIEGANVTMPHKTEAAELMDDRSEDVGRLRALNTIVVGEDGSLRGHNTDAPGFDRFLRRDAGFDPRGRRAILFGAGGAARACALALARAGLGELRVAVRDPDRTDPLRDVLADEDLALEVIAFDRAEGVETDLVINATPLGAHGETPPVPSLGPDVVVVDLLYRPAVTPLQTLARSAGAAAFGGLGLLLHQAALSFELWTGREPPIDLMSAAALAELADHP
jgi:shikimate dehydrogenase